MEPLRIAGIGEIVWDMLPTGKRLGGAPLNFAYFARQLGAEACIVSAVGNDSLGAQAAAEAAAAGIDLSLLQRNDLPTGRVAIRLDASGSPHYDIVEHVAWDRIECRAETREALRRMDAVCWGTLARRFEFSRRQIGLMLEALPASCLKVFDVNIRQHYYDTDTIESSLRCADILKFSEEEMPLLTSALGLKGSPQTMIAQLTARYDLKYVVFTCGARHSEIYDPQGLRSHIETPRVAVTDTIGAGDSFTAVFVASLLQGRSVAESHARAVDISAFVCTQSGAIHPLPDGVSGRP